MTKDEQDNFKLFCEQATDAQLQGIYDKERKAGRDEERRIVVRVASARNVMLELSSWRG
jgi:hypothetical protein